MNFELLTKITATVFLIPVLTACATSLQYEGNGLAKVTTDQEVTPIHKDIVKPSSQLSSDKSDVKPVSTPPLTSAPSIVSPSQPIIYAGTTETKQQPTKITVSQAKNKLLLEKQSDRQLSPPQKAVSTSATRNITPPFLPSQPTDTPTSTQKTTPTKVEQDVPQVASNTLPTQTAIVPPPTELQQKDVDISDQYVGFDNGVPIIINPTSCGTNKYEIKIDVDNVPKEKGQISADLYGNDKENFLVGNTAVVRVWATAHKGRTSFCIPLTKPGEYAIAIYHDKNGNKDFDKNFLGIPKERFGMSNNPKFGTKSPKYEQGAFQVPESGAHIVIKLRKASDIL